jgi:hypothetical protein
LRCSYILTDLQWARAIVHSHPYLWDSRELVRAAALLHAQRQAQKKGPTGFGGAAGVGLQAAAAAAAGNAAALPAPVPVPAKGKATAAASDASS